MSPSEKKAFGVFLFCVSITNMFFGLGGGAIFTQYVQTQAKPTQSEIIQASSKDNQSQSDRGEIITYEDGTVCIELSAVRLECWNIGAEDEETPKTKPESSKTKFFIYD